MASQPKPARRRLGSARSGARRRRNGRRWWRTQWRRLRWPRRRWRRCRGGLPWWEASLLVGYEKWHRAATSPTVAPSAWLTLVCSKDHQISVWLALGSNGIPFSNFSNRRSHGIRRDSSPRRRSSNGIRSNHSSSSNGIHFNNSSSGPHRNPPLHLPRRQSVLANQAPLAPQRLIQAAQ